MTTNVEMEDDDSELADTRKLVQKHNRKNKKSGGFQSMGLSRETFRGIIRKGYKVPTPIQRKTIPLILEGRDCVAMARTGSGKTAAFLIPLFEKLLSRNTMTRLPRALILSPTRELALQTSKFFKELGKFSDLRVMCVLGGESMEKQFAAMHENPDVLIATPGRFVHLCVEMSLKLEAIQYVVFDEADRLFEMGFGEQLREILARLPDDRQTVLFSATLPKLLVDFAKAGLNDPTLVRLDVDSKIPETLKLAFFHCRPEGKPAALLHLLQSVIPSGQQTIVFLATRHHVEYIHVLLDLAGISNTFIYSQLDPAARKINAAKFQTRKCSVLLVTDLAARGIDIPLLDNVINYNFPAKSKLFIHRVGRVARAGRTGTAYSFVAGDELAYFVDLQLFLGNPLLFSTKRNAEKDWHNVLGSIPQFIHDEYADQIRRWFDVSLDLTNLKKVSENGYVQYLKSRPGASIESVKRAKGIKNNVIGPHPLLLSTDNDEERACILAQMKNFRPPSTIFEVGNTTKNIEAKVAMSGKRSKHETVIEKYRSSKVEKKNSDDEEEEDETVELEESSAMDIQSAFDTIVESKKVKEVKTFKKLKKTIKSTRQKDEENFIGYQPKDHHTEAGYSMMNGFEAQASKAVLDLTGDDDGSLRKKKVLMRWDAKTKKYVRDQDDKKKIKTESGVWIPASYKSDRYKKWKERSKTSHFEETQGDDDDDNMEDPQGERKSNRDKVKKRKMQGALPDSHPAMKKARNAVPAHRKGPKNEIKRPEQILKLRQVNEKKKMKNISRKKRRKK